jgi:hypothetical protein
MATGKVRVTADIEELPQPAPEPTPEATPNPNPSP